MPINLKIEFKAQFSKPETFDGNGPDDDLYVLSQVHFSRGDAARAYSENLEKFVHWSILRKFWVEFVNNDWFICDEAKDPKRIYEDTFPVWGVFLSDINSPRNRPPAYN